VSEEGALHWWHLNTSEVASLQRHAGTVTSVVLDPDGLHALCLSDDGTVSYCNFVTGTVKSYPTSADRVSSMVALHEGRFALSARGEGLMSVWNLATGFAEPVRVLVPLSHIAVDQSGANAVAGSIFGLLYWVTQSDATALVGHDDLPLLSVIVSLNGAFAISL